MIDLESKQALTERTISYNWVKPAYDELFRNALPGGVLAPYCALFADTPERSIVQLLKIACIEAQAEDGCVDILDLTEAGQTCGDMATIKIVDAVADYAF